MKRVFLDLFMFIFLILISTSCTNKQNNSGKFPTENLPQKAIEYITKHYSDYKIEGASYDPLCTGENAIDVAISKNENLKYSLIFLMDGTFVQKEEDINLTDAPNSILNSIRTKYPGYTASSRIEQLTMADGSIQFLVDLKKDEIIKEVIFKTDGSVVCEN